MASETPPRRSAMAGLLDDGFLREGQHEVTTRLRLVRHARLVPRGDVEALTREMHRAVQVWRGASQPLVPVVDRRLPSE